MGQYYDYPELSQMASQAEPFRTLLDTEYHPFAVPGDMLETITTFSETTGQPVPIEPGQFIRCCLESLALTYRHTLNCLENVLNQRFDVLHIVGGGGKNAVLNQMTAEAIGRKVVVGPYEATAVGNILIQAMGSGCIESLAQLRHIVAKSFTLQTFMPDQAEL